MSDTLSVDARLRLGAFTLDARFEAPAHGVTCLFGPSGAGKSLLLSVLAGLRRVDEGRIALGTRVLDDSGAHVPPHQRGIGLVFQEARLFPHLSVRGNLDYAHARAPQARRKLGLEQTAEHFDIAPLLDRPVRNLSGGEKGRVALARAMVSAPDLLLLDEPFAALDGTRRSAFLNTLRGMHEAFGLPMLVVTHQIDDAATLADHLIGIESGGIVASGDLSDVATQSPFRALLTPHDIGAALPMNALRHASGANAGRIWVRADHVVLAAVEPHGLSARNIWQSEIMAIDRESDSALLVHLRASAGVMLARVTPEAAMDLNLAPGQKVWAIVKAHSI